jgi:hypothetical protein
MNKNEIFAWNLLGSLFFMDQFYYLIQNNKKIMEITTNNEESIYTLVKKYHPTLTNKEAIIGAILVTYICKLNKILENKLPIVDYETEFFNNELKNIQLD